MARTKLVTTHDLRKLRVVGGKKGTKRIGKVKSCVFHPAERRCIGFIVKRPDFLWMFHRKDLFVALDGFDFVDGRIRIRPEADTTGSSACKRMGIDWNKCVIWEGMPLMTADETAIGYVGNVTLDLATGKVESLEASNGATQKLLLGTLEVPGSYIQGFKRGMGADLAIKEDSRDAGEDVVFKGAILVSDDVWELQPEGGWAEAAGQFTAKASARVKEATDAAKPKVQQATAAAGEAINDGAYAVGKQVAASKGMFSAFKEEFNAAKDGVEPSAEVAAAEAALDEDGGMEDALKKRTTGMFASFKEEFDAARKGEAVDEDDVEEESEEDIDDVIDEPEEDAEDDDYEGEYEDDDEPESERKPATGLGMFAAFKEEFDKAAKGE